MKLATRKNGTRDGELLIVSKDNSKAMVVGDIAPTMQSLLDDWADKSPALLERYESLNAGTAEAAFDVDVKPFTALFLRHTAGLTAVRILTTLYWFVRRVGLSRPLR